MKSNFIKYFMIGAQWYLLQATTLFISQITTWSFQTYNPATIIIVPVITEIRGLSSISIVDSNLVSQLLSVTDIKVFEPIGNFSWA